MQVIDPKYIARMWVEGVITKKTVGVPQNNGGRRTDPYCSLELVFVTEDGKGAQTIRSTKINLSADYPWDDFAEGQWVRLPVRVSVYGAMGAMLSIKVEPARIWEADEEAKGEPAEKSKSSFYPSSQQAAE
jgi:hypothetical protein